MAKKIYIGNMIQDLQSSIADLQTDIGTMSTDMANVVAELINVKGAVAQGINEVITQDGSDFVIPLTSSDLTTDSTYKTIATFKCLNSGALVFSGNAKQSTATSGTGINIRISINGAAAVNLDYTEYTTAYTPFSHIFTVNRGDVVKLDYNINYHPYTGTIESGCTISYSLKDIVNDGAIVLL